jgi:uncharacterized RDD family membrane protein YckC
VGIKILHIYNGETTLTPTSIRDRVIAQFIDGIVLSLLSNVIFIFFSQGQLYSVWVTPMVPFYLMQSPPDYLIGQWNWLWGGTYFTLSVPLLSEVNISCFSPLHWIVFSLYYTLFHRYLGQTIGKMMKGLVVLERTGHLLSGKVAFIRWLGYVLSLIPVGMGFWVCFFKKRKQCWHDRLTGTTVSKFGE